MNAPAAIPAGFLDHARRHLRREGRPLLYGPRRQTETGLLACPNPSSGRWAILLDPSTVPGPVEEVLLAGGLTETMCRLSRYAGVALHDLPRVFEAEGQEVGSWQECDGVVFVSDALALSCLSYLLRHHEPRTGFFVWIAGGE